MARELMTIDKLNETYQSIRHDVRNFLEWKAFVEQLKQLSAPEIIKFHFELLRDRTQELFYLMLREGFSARTDEKAIQFLIAQSNVETDPGMRADIVVMLGLMQRPEALNIAREYLSDSDGEARYAACTVLGLIGKSADIKRLRTPLIEDEFVPVRGAAARAHVQLCDRLPRQKNILLSNLQGALSKEQDEEVSAWIVIAAGDILKKRFGVRFDGTDGDFVGDIQEAKVLCTRALSKLDL